MANGIYSKGIGATVKAGSPQAGDVAVEIADIAPPSPGQVMRMRAARHNGFHIGLAVVVIAVLCAIFAPLLAPYDPYAQDLTRRLVPPVWEPGGSWAHIFGTDGFGRDYLSRIIYGTRVTMIVAFGAAVMSGIVGSLLGIVGGYFGGRVDALVVFLINVKLALPGVLIALSLVSIFGGSLLVVVLVIGFLFWDRFAVVTRTATQQLRANDYVAAAEAIGASRSWILFREILPNLMNQIIVVASLEMAVAILVEAALSFLGLGIQPPTPSWGLLVSEGRPFMFFKPYLIMLPGLAIFALVMAINLLGDGVRDITAPQGRG
jgi:peptide/nickel transport system permease protein